MNKHGHGRWLAIAVGGVLAFTAWAAVATPARGAVDPGADTLTILDSQGGANKRNQALDRLWQALLDGQADRAAVRETLKQVLWKSSAPVSLRQNALGKLFLDPTPEGQADNRKFLRLRMPTEAQWPVIDVMCKEIAAKGAEDQAWREMDGALVRSYARRVPTPLDADRPERAALLALHPGQSIEQVVFGVYVKPGGERGELPGQSSEIIEKQRQAAWELLGRLDPSGATRRDLLAAVSADDPAVKPIARAAAELRIVPVTGSELAWLNELIDSKDPGAADWWSSTQAAVQKLSAAQAQGLVLRHLEPVRWAAKNRPEWLTADRDTLLAELSKRLEPRRKWRKSEGLGVGEIMSRELLSDWQDQLVWGDVLAILVIDESLKDPRVIDSLFVQAAADRNDSSAEYGGAIFATDAVPMQMIGGVVKPKWDVDPARAGFVVHGYAPRPAQRVNDRTFVASDDMFQAEGAGGRALAHYHFHAQSVNNTDYAGPGRGDFDYAATHGRSCVVFTSVRPGVLDADYYQRSTIAGVPGVQIDLGEVVSKR